MLLIMYFILRLLPLQCLASVYIHYIYIIRIENRNYGFVIDMRANEYVRYFNGQAITVCFVSYHITKQANLKAENCITPEKICKMLES